MQDGEYFDGSDYDQGDACETLLAPEWSSSFYDCGYSMPKACRALVTPRTALVDHDTYYLSSNRIYIWPLFGNRW